MQTPYSLRCNDNIYHEGNLSKIQISMCFLKLVESRKRTARLQGSKKNGNCKRKSRVQKIANCTRRDQMLNSMFMATLYAFIFKFITYFSFTLFGY